MKRKLKTAKRPKVRTTSKETYYVGSNRMAPNWKKKSLREAVAHAQELLREDPDMETATIVKVVAIVRRRVVETPIIVEKV